MPAQQPFTALCQALARSRNGDRADLHAHTTCSDGAYTPAEVVDLARRSGLCALAITDHDTIDGLAPARAAAGTALEIVPGVELTARHHGREFHLLGYFFDEGDASLRAALDRLRDDRRGRYDEIVGTLRKRGLAIAERPAGDAQVLGLKHVAQALVTARHVSSERQAFSRYLDNGPNGNVPPVGLPVAEAIALVRGAGGVAAWAHPANECSREMLRELRDLGMQAVEAEYPGWRRSRIGQLRAWAKELGLAITGGSDCHGPGRGLGAAGVTRAELEHLRALSACSR